MRILLLGSRGQIGWELRRALATLGEVVALDRESGDLEQLDALRNAVRHFEPRIIANAAAYTDVDRAELEPARADRVNAKAPGVLADEATRSGAWLVHYSTDYVFDGSGSAPWREDDAPAPLSVYGATKLRGEQAVRDSGCKHLLFRTQWIYSTRRSSFVSKILAQAAERDRLEVVADRHGAPTDAALVADVTAEMLELALVERTAPGIYHLAASGETTLHGYAQFIVAEGRRAGLPLRATAETIAAVTTAERPEVARRPSNSRLDVAKLEAALDRQLPDWHVGVARAIAELGRAERGAKRAE